MKQILLIFLFILLCNWLFAPSSFTHKKTCYIEVGKIEQPDYLLQSVMFTESSFREKVINKKEQAYGIIQITQETINEANDIIGYEKYKLEDGLERQKSIEIWYLVQKHRNPDYDIKKACLIWNGYGKSSEKYYQKVSQYLEKLINPSL